MIQKPRTHAPLEQRQPAPRRARGAGRAQAACYARGRRRACRRRPRRLEPHGARRTRPTPSACPVRLRVRSRSRLPPRTAFWLVAAQRVCTLLSVGRYGFNAAHVRFCSADGLRGGRSSRMCAKKPAIARNSGNFYAASGSGEQSAQNARHLSQGLADGGGIGRRAQGLHVRAGIHRRVDLDAFVPQLSHALKRS